MIRATIAALLAAGPAAAHDLPGMHAHPHGVETVLLALAGAGAAAWLIWSRTR